MNYGAVAYLRTEDDEGRYHVSFLAARSRIAPKKQQTIPRLELCAALTGAQLAAVMQRELTLKIDGLTLWSDSTTVLYWIQSTSIKYKVFVGTRIGEIQTLTEGATWRYVGSAENPADDITRGKTLQQIASQDRWSQGPSFLIESEDLWPKQPEGSLMVDVEAQEVKKSIFCGLTTSKHEPARLGEFRTYGELYSATARKMAEEDEGGSPSSDDYRRAEDAILR